MTCEGGCAYEFYKAHIWERTLLLKKSKHS